MNTEQIQAIETINAYFVSGNDIPVGRAMIKREEWELVKAAFNSQAKSVPAGIVRGDSSDTTGQDYWNFYPSEFWKGELFTQYTVYASPQQADKVRELEKAMWTLKQIADLDPKSDVGNAIFMARVAIDEAMKGEWEDG
jgi:hypothetical protein